MIASNIGQERDEIPLETHEATILTLLQQILQQELK